MDLPVGTALGKYTVVRPLGAGGMGIVVLARHGELGSLHAVKVLRAEGPEVDSRLRQEGRLQATLSHPNVVKVTDLVEVGGRTGLVMEYVDGPTLAEFVAKHRLLSFPEIDRLARGILRGVAEAHDHGWIHRDLKPANILLQITRDEIVPKVADFGLAKVLVGDGPALGHTSRHGLGTRGYMPLEQLVGLTPDARMDVFALGVVLYELVVGRPAFSTVDAWERAIRSGSYPDPDREGLPVRMRDAIRASFAERDARPATARELLTMWVGDEGSDLPPLRATPLRGDDHLTRARLVSETLTPTERVHLEGCVRCRSEARLARACLAPDAALLPPDTLTPSSLNLLPPVPERRGWWWLLVPLGFGLVGVIVSLSVRGPAPEPAPVRAVPVPVPAVVVPSAPPPVPLPAPAPPPPRVRPTPAPVPVGTGTVIVNTVGGPAGRFQVDDGPIVTVGPLRKQQVSTGSHRVRVFPHDGDTPVWEGPITLVSDEEVVLCWDLAERTLCAK